MAELDAAARAAGYEVTATVLMTHGADALLEMPGEGQPVRWPAAEVATGLHVPVHALPGALAATEAGDFCPSCQVLN